MNKRCILSMLFVCTFFVVIMSGCNSKRYGNYYVYSLGASDGGGAGAQKQEYTLDFGTTYKNPTAPKEASVKFLDMSFEGTYHDTMTSDLFPHPIHEFTTQSRADFALDAKTGELRFLDLVGFCGESSPAEKHLSQEECAVLADHMLGQLLDDFSEYTLTSSSVRKIDDKDKYSFDYCRMIGGLESKDVIRIGFYSTGELALYDIRTYGTLKGASLPASYDEDKVTEAVRAKMEDVYAPRKDKITFDYTEKAREVVRLKDGSVGLYVPVEVAIYNSGSGSEPSYCEVVEFIIRLN